MVGWVLQNVQAPVLSSSRRLMQEDGGKLKPLFPHSTVDGFLIGRLPASYPTTHRHRLRLSTTPNFLASYLRTVRVNACFSYCFRRFFSHVIIVVFVRLFLCYF